MITAKNLCKSFGDIKAVDDVSFVAKDGKITGLLGPNGAGKSTTLRMLYTVFKPDSGSAEIDGNDIQGDTLQVKRNLGVLTHGAGIYERLSARENIRYYGAVHGMSGRPLNRRIDELAELLEMQDFIERRTKGFSQGQTTKVALARALVHSPKNVLLDEPTNGLDVMATRGLRKVIKRLKESGHCVLFSSHIMQEVAALCDEIIIISKGTIVAQGSPESLLAATGESSLEEAFVQTVGSDEGLI